MENDINKTNLAIASNMFALSGASNGTLQDFAIKLQRQFRIRMARKKILYIKLRRQKLIAESSAIKLQVSYCVVISIYTSLNIYWRALGKSRKQDAELRF